MSAEPGALEARGPRVRVAPVGERDLAPYRIAVEQSRQRLVRWNPIDPDDLATHLTSQSPSHRSFVIHALDPEGEHDIVGAVNVANVVRGRFESAGRGTTPTTRMPVAAYSPKGCGWFWTSPSHRSLPAEWVCTASYPRPRKIVVLVDGTSGRRRSALAGELSAELQIPRFSEDVLSREALWGLLSDSPMGGVVEGEFSSDDTHLVIEGLSRSGVDPAKVPEVWWLRSHEEASSRSLGLGETVGVDPGEDVGRRSIVRIALQASSQPPQGFSKG